MYLAHYTLGMVMESIAFLCYSSKSPTLYVHTSVLNTRKGTWKAKVADRIITMYPIFLRKKKHMKKDSLLKKTNSGKSASDYIHIHEF